MLAALMALALFMAVACSGAADAPPAAVSQEASGSSVISYAGAASRLDGMEPTEAEEQLRDWTRIGLAWMLGFDTAQLRDAFYDTAPVRDPAFNDLAEQPTGPGRSLYDGRGVLHVLVPHDDPHAARTIGLLVDDFRADAGIDADRVAIHRYQHHPETRTIALTSEPPVPTAEARSAYGYVEMRVDQADGLTAFLAQTQHLSLLEARGSEIWAGGWRWPGTPGAQLTHEDISVLQRAYVGSASVAPEFLPGFSLDPGPPETAADLLAVAPGMSPQLADRLAAGEFPAGLDEVIRDALFHGDPVPAGSGLPTDRIQLWALRTLLLGGATYGQATYYGRLEGTEVGMTLFYTDYIAKDWSSGAGEGVPTDAVGGFLPDSQAVVPWGHCPGLEDPLSESGRLWFGQSDAGFTLDGDSVLIGAQATRLFSRSGEIGAEVEPSYGSGRGLRWWDQHYQAVADYEPQYHRLDQIMRWSGAIEWLATQSGAVLPQLGDDQIRSDLRFQDWYAANNDLRERSPIVFVQPPSATQEAVLTQPSETFDTCGYLGINGGVSLANRGARTGGQAFRADLDPAVNRSGLLTSATDPTTGTLRIETKAIDDAGQVTDSVARTLSQPSDGRAVVLVNGSGRRVASFGGLRISRAQTATRDFELRLEAGAGSLAQRVDFQGLELGELITRRIDVSSATIQWRSGALDRAGRALRSMQDRWASGRGSGPGGPPAGEPPAGEPPDGVLYAFDDGPGRRLYRIGDRDWLERTDQPVPPGEELVLQGGGPAPPETGGPQFFQGRRVPPPDASGGFIEVSGGQARIGALQRDARPVRVETADGTVTTAFQAGDSLSAPIGDPVLGLSGTVEGAALMRDWATVQNAMRSADQARSRAVLMRGDGVAFGYSDRVVIAGAGHPWYERALRAVDPASPNQLPLFRLENGHAIHVGPDLPPPIPGSQRRTALGEARDEARASDATYYFDRSLLPFEGGAILWDNLPRDRRVIVSEASPEAVPPGSTSPPDARSSGGREGIRYPTFDGAGGGPGGGGSAGGSGGIGVTRPGPIFFVSQDCESPEAAGAEECAR